MTDPHKKIAVSIVLFLVLLVSIGGFMGNSSVGASSNAQSQSAGRATNGGGTNPVVAGLGVVEPRSGTVDVAALMPGVLAAVHVREGDRVRKGDLLAELVNEDLKARLAQAEAVLAAKTAQMNLVVRGPRPEEVNRAQAQLREEESNMKLLQLQVSRRQTLVRDGAVSTEAFNEVSSRLAASRERLSALTNSVAILRQGSRPEEIEAARADVRLAQSQIAEAQATLAKSYIRAGMDGIVLRRYREPGEALSTQPAIAVLQIADTSNLVVRTQIDETDIMDVRVGQTAQVTATALNGRRLSGRVERISPRVGAKTVSSDLPTEKRDTRVLDVIVALEPNSTLPVNFRVDVVIDVKGGATPTAALRGSLESGASSSAPEATLARSEDDRAMSTGTVAAQAASPAVEEPNLPADVPAICRELCPAVPVQPLGAEWALSRLAIP